LFGLAHDPRSARGSSSPKFSFNAAHCRIRCGPHKLNLIGQTLPRGVDGDAYDNNVGKAVKLGKEHQLMKD
jgi:hypothetical protein